ncbi:MAG: hypothetical protein ER33_01590 [Cyanobium sp. CACIAM 14]|nr:MAG: hypothetical protein ER33_01590 [Cyanobium sp. CACIAM 14]
MKNKLLLLVVILVSAVSGRAEAKISNLQKLFVFGDSLTDTGNSMILTEDYGHKNPLPAGYPPFWPPQPPYWVGRSSNGPVAPEYLWQAFHPGSPGPGASLAGGTNYAINGSTTGLENFNTISPGVLPAFRPAYAQFGAAWQLAQFRSKAPVFDPASSLFLVWLFPNDLLYWFNTGFMTPGTVTGAPGSVGDVSSLIGNGITNIAQTIGTLASSGATQFLVPNMPDLSRTPLFLNAPAVQRDQLSAITDVFNQALDQRLIQLEGRLQQSQQSISIDIFDTEALFDAVLDDPQAYGFSSTQQPCLSRVNDVVTVCADPDISFFWDDFHPTTAAHALFGQRFAEAVAAPVPGPLPVFGAAVAFAWSRRLRRRVRCSAIRPFNAAPQLPRNQP